MDLDIGWIFLGLPMAFGLGWLASRFDLRQLRMENRSNPKAYFKGLNYLLNEQQDQAIDAFIEAVQRDPDTSELHFALGNCFDAVANLNVLCVCTNICWHVPTSARLTANARNTTWLWISSKRASWTEQKPRCNPC